jgi:tight adherence protein C
VVGLVRRNTSDSYLLEVPQQLEVMAARLRSGDSFYKVLSLQNAAHGNFAEALRRLSLRLTYGESIEEGLRLLDQECRSPIVSEFANKTLLSLRRGTPIAEQFVHLAESARGQLRVAQLKNAGKNELKMLVPLVFLILPVTVFFAIFPSLQILQLGV